MTHLSMCGCFQEGLDTYDIPPSCVIFPNTKLTFELVNDLVTFGKRNNEKKMNQEM